jgi:intermediate peptidase
MLRSLGYLATRRPKNRLIDIKIRPQTPNISRLSSTALSSPAESKSTLFTKYGSDDAQLPSLFDRPSLSSYGTSSRITGLFGNSDLVDPLDFIQLAQRTQKYTKRLVDRIASYSESAPGSPNDLSALVGLVDRLSDTLCSVIDTAEFVRNSHPDPRWVTAANNAYESLCSWMNELNTHVGLYKVTYTFPYVDYRRLTC